MAEFKIPEIEGREPDTVTYAQDGRRIEIYGNIISITIDNCLAIHDIKVIEGDDRLFVAMPSRKENGVFRDIVHPIDEKTRNMLEDAILESYTRYVMTVEAADIR